MTGVPVIYKQGSARAMGAIGQAAQRPLGNGILTGAPVASTGVKEQGVGTPRKPRDIGGFSLPTVPMRKGGLL